VFAPRLLSDHPRQPASLRPSFTMLIGVLALQGAFLEHIDKFRSIGVAAKEVSHANTMYRE
jgi:hypothetical protein